MYFYSEFFFPFCILLFWARVCVRVLFFDFFSFLLFSCSIFFRTFLFSCRYGPYLNVLWSLFFYLRAVYWLLSLSMIMSKWIVCAFGENLLVYFGGVPLLLKGDFSLVILMLAETGVCKRIISLQSRTIQRVWTKDGHEFSKEQIRNGESYNLNELQMKFERARQEN